MRKHKKTLLFLVKFFVSYFMLVAIYSAYLEAYQQKEGGFKNSPITIKVAEQTAGVLEFLGYNTDLVQHTEELSIKFFFEGNYISRIIEGCNSISVIILFIAFIIAFKGSLKNTIIFIILGSLFIYVINILRIALLTILFHKYPEYQDFLHNLVFPGIIYGAIFLLWILWVNQFSNYKNEQTS